MSATQTTSKLKVKKQQQQQTKVCAPLCEAARETTRSGDAVSPATVHHAMSISLPLHLSSQQRAWRGPRANALKPIPLRALCRPFLGRFPIR